MSNSKTEYLSQRQRLAILAIYVIGLLVVSRLLTAEFFPSDAAKRIWLVSAIGYCLFSLLSAPWFRPPRDSLTNAVAAGLLLCLLDFGGIQNLLHELNIVRWVSVVLAGVTVVAAVLAMILFDHGEPGAAKAGKLSRLSYRISDTLGKGEILFTPPILIGIFAFYQSSMVSVLWLLITWLALVVLKPLELTFRLLKILREPKSHESPPLLIGELLRVDHPNLVRASIDSISHWEKERPVVACFADGSQRIVVPISVYVQESGMIGTGLCCGETHAYIEGVQPRMLYLTNTADANSSLIADAMCGHESGDLAGIVVEDSRISTIFFEVVCDSLLQEGTLVCCYQGDQEVFYQVLDARTGEESFNQNPGGKHTAVAAQLGRIGKNGEFIKHGWLPEMNAPVFVCRSVSVHGCAPKDEFIVGVVPGTEIPVRAGFKDLLEYHSAILGVTGTGKTELSFDIIRKALALDTKVFCVDFTEEYKNRLREYSPQALGLDPAHAGKLNEKLFAVDTGQYGAGPQKEALKKFVDQIREPINSSVDNFLRTEGKSLGIFELPEITNTKATLRATELYLSSIMAWARTHRKARSILVVLEEAHTIIPETMGAGFDFDTQWVVSRISQIALQGRKYGVGLLLVSQRTALVSKSILSQCNTHFTFSLIDKTSLDYLSNVHSPAHVKLIPNLGFLDAIVFGRAIRSERPVRIKIPFDANKEAASNALDRPLVAATEE